MLFAFSFLMYENPPLCPASVTAVKRYLHTGGACASNLHVDAMRSPGGTSFSNALVCGRSSIPILALLFIAFSASALNCTQELLTPVAPSWDVDLTLPLAHRTYTLLQVVEKDTSLLHAGVGNLITYATSVQTSPTYVGDLLSISPRDTTVQINLGTFGIDPYAWSAPVEIPWLIQGIDSSVPDTTANFADLHYIFSSFESVTFAGGTVSFTLQNNLPVPLDVMSPISLYDRFNNVVAVFQFVPSRIPASSSQTVSNDLTGKTLTNAARVSGLRFHTPGSATPLPIPKNEDLIVATVTTSGLKAKAAVFAEIPAQRLIENDVKSLPFDDSTLVKELKLRSGALRIFATSRVDLDMVLKLKLRELLRGTEGNLAAFEDSLVLPSRSSRSLIVDLAGCRLQSQDGDLIRSLEVVSSVILPLGSGGPVTVNDTDKVTIQVSRMASLIADSAVAVLRPTWVGVDKMIAPHFGDLPTKFSGQINVASAGLTLNAASSIGFPVDIFVKLGARRSAAGDSVFLYVPAAQRRLRSGSGIVQFDPLEVGRFFSAVTGKLPDSLRVMGSVLVNPIDVYNPTLSGVGTVGRNSSFGGILDLQIPLRLGIVDGMFRDTMSVGKDINRKRINDVNYGKMFIEVINGLPMQLEVLLFLLSNDKQSLLRVPQTGQPIQVGAAQVDADGNVTAPVQTMTSVELSERDVRQFNAGEFLAMSAGLATTPGTPSVRFKTSDSIQVRVWSQLSYRINK